MEIADLPANSRISETFDVDRLRPSYIDHTRKHPHHPAAIRGVTQPGTVPVFEYEVDKIVDWRKNKPGVVEFLVTSVGLNEQDNSPSDTQAVFTGAKEALSDFILEPKMMSSPTFSTGTVGYPQPRRMPTLYGKELV